MKKVIALLFVALLFGKTYAQQAQVEKRSKIPYVYKDFQDAKIEFAFGKDKIYKANIFLKDASLLYKKDSTIMKANLFGVIFVTFNDALYRRTGENQMGKVLAQKGEIFLTEVTTIDLAQMREDASTGKNSTFLDLPELNLFIETNADYWANGEGDSWPLKTEYFFIVNGETFPAAEKIVKKHIRNDKKADFKELMKNRKWSWKDAGSLKELVDYF